MDRTQPPSSLRVRVAVFLRVFTSHRLIVQSSLPEASVLPSGLNASELIDRVCPSKTVSLPVFTSHSLIVLPAYPEATVSPSGLKATDQTCISSPSPFLPAKVS